MENYEDMSIEQLEKENNKLSARRLEIKSEQMKIVAVLERKRSEKEAAAKVARMTDKEKQAMARVIQAEGIESTEAVGEPGAK